MQRPESIERIFSNVILFSFVHFATSGPNEVSIAVCSRPTKTTAQLRVYAGNRKWNMGDLLPPISTTFSILPSITDVRVILCAANCFWRVINRECRFNLAHLSHLFSPRAGTDWKTRHQWIFTQLVFKAKPGQPTNVDWTTPQAPPLPKKEKQVFS